jgi:regulator of protease activity HflC (stomatin/prohibitin superfamily)
VGVKVKLLGDDKGVNTQEVLGPGRYWIGFNEELYVFPTFSQTTVWEGEQAIAFQTAEGMNVDADVGITYSIDADMVPAVFQRYRRGVDELTAIVLRNAVQDAMINRASPRTVKDVYGEGKVALLVQVLEDVRSQFDPLGIKVETLSWRSEVRVPETVKAAIDATIEADQQASRRRNEVASAKAEADKKIEEARGETESTKLRTAAEVDRITRSAEAQAKANEELAKSLTPELIRSQEIQAWDGKLPQFIGGDAPIPFISVNGGN